MSRMPWTVGTLEPLRFLVQSSRGQLRSLVVDLNVSKGPYNCGRNFHPDELDYWPVGFLSSGVLTEWLETAKVIGPSFKPRTLELSFICNVADVEAAEAIAASLRHFPIMLSCDLRLSSKPNGQIQGIAKEAATKAVGQTPPPPSLFRFTDLPAELRLEILKYTDLITPLKEVEWNPKDGYYLRYRTITCIRAYKPSYEFGTCPPPGDWTPNDRVPCDQNFYHHSCQFRNCWQGPAENGCFCQRYHAAYTASSSSRKQCACWMPPQPLFLVSRQLYQDAQFVFFHHNRIIVTPPEGLWPRSPSPEAEVGMYPASIFLRSALPPSSLGYLRFLDIIFAPVNHVPKDDDPAYLDWKRTLEWARDKLELPRLTLRVEIADYYGVDQVPESRRRPMGETLLQICTGYIAILRPLEVLGSPALRAMSGDSEGEASEGADGEWGENGGLNRLFVHLASPFSYSVMNSPGWRRKDAERWASYRLEEKAERRVMGMEYDGEKMGKWGLKLGEWEWAIILRRLEGES
ncbi:hypothetical protein VP1G_09991 [Cytospora mali]|uniref:F-box domain-containing protein n=1 Tax=Cytospora mali TaxID=578113 RepID=A0A194VFT2_CYTMA|nr:hypothetical protein VP1G_09991 [Valsa mali var. pyri (nom. inval.)]